MKPVAQVMTIFTMVGAANPDASLEAFETYEGRCASGQLGCSEIPLAE